MPLKSLRDLVAWQRAMSLLEASFALSARIRRRSHFALAGQLERASISVAANIAEGYGRSSKREYRHFLSIAMGSLREVETLLIAAERVAAASRELVASALELCDETGRVLYGLRRSLPDKST